MLHAVIMAGGSGTRFWPASRTRCPKQLLDLLGGGTMLEATVKRLGDLAPPERVLVVTNRSLVKPILEQIPSLPQHAVVGEPCKRDTAPCVGLAAALVANQDPDAIMAVMPADHVIQPDDSFQAGIRLGAEMVDQDPSRIITFGIRPTYAAESFGYIERGAAMDLSQIDSVEGQQVFQVARFREKPDAETAQEYLDTERFYWNSGIFIWKAATILDALKRHEPQMYAHLETIADSIGQPDFAEVLEREFSAIVGKSIDYAVMEHAENVCVIEASFQWDDLGSWQSLARLRGTDELGNTLVGKHLAVDTRDTIVRTSEEHLVVALGLHECIIVHTDDATLVATKQHEESVRKVVKLLEERDWKEHL